MIRFDQVTKTYAGTTRPALSNVSLERALQEDGTCWIGGTTWRDERLLRISVSNWSTTPDDVDRVVAAIGRLRSELIADN